MSAKEEYRNLCRTEESIPIFSRDWWLDAACGTDRWEVILIREKDAIQAALPFYLPRPQAIIMPCYTQTMGIWFAPSANDVKDITLQEHRQQIAKQIIDRLKPYSFFRQHFNYDFTDWLPFYWNNFTQTTRYTYLLKNLKQTDALWEKMSQHARRNIKKAKERFQITVRQGVTIDEFMRLHALTFERQQANNIQDIKVLQRIIEACRQLEQGEIWGGYDPEGRLHAVALVVWQKQSAYYLAGGGDLALRRSCAHSLVLWEAIRHVSEFTDTFDFEGSMLPGVERFFREFGGIQTPYFAIQKGKMSFWDRIMIKLKS